MNRLTIIALLLLALPALAACGGNGYAAGNNNGGVIGASILRFPMNDDGGTARR